MLIRKDDIMNNQMNFDPITGQPINQNNNNIIPNNGIINTVEQNNVPVQPENTLNQQPSETTVINPQQVIQNIPTVEQTKQEFINNTQANSSAKKEDKKDGPNIAFIIFLFIIIFASIFFLFPYLQKTL